MKRSSDDGEKITVISVETVRAAAMNSGGPSDMTLELEAVDPKALTIDDKIYGVKLNPVVDNAKRKSSPILYPAINVVEVETLSGRAKEGFITVNGTIDLPKDAGRKLHLEDSYFTSEEAARIICQAVTEVELDRCNARLKEENDIREFLEKQLNDNRF